MPRSNALLFRVHENSSNLLFKLDSRNILEWWESGQETSLTTLRSAVLPGLAHDSLSHCVHIGLKTLFKLCSWIYMIVGDYLIRISSWPNLSQSAWITRYVKYAVCHQNMFHTGNNWSIPGKCLRVLAVGDFLGCFPSALSATGLCELGSVAWTQNLRLVGSFLLRA